MGGGGKDKLRIIVGTSTASMAYEDQVVILLHESLSDKLRTYCFLSIVRDAISGIENKS